MNILEQYIKLAINDYIKEIKTYGLEPEIEEDEIRTMKAFEEWLTSLKE